MFEIVHDKMRIEANAARQWLVYLDGRLLAECTSERQAKNFVATQRAKARYAAHPDNS